jgi:hypothetical protein
MVGNPEILRKKKEKTWLKKNLWFPVICLSGINLLSSGKCIWDFVFGVA